MSIRNFAYILIFLFFFPLRAAAGTLEFDLKGAVQQALAANPGLEAKLLVLERAKLDVGVAQSYFWPTASVTWGKTRLWNSGGTGTSEDFSNKTLSKGLRISYAIFSGFAHLNNMHKALLTVDVERARHDFAKLELIANVQLQFLQLLRAREDMRTVMDSMKRIETQLKAAKAFVAVGMAPFLNVLQNEVELSTVKQREIRVANTIRNAEVMLNRYLGYEPEAKVAYKGDLRSFSGVVDYTEEEAVNVALSSRPDLEIANKSIAVAFKEANITAGRFLPSVSLNADNTNYKKFYTDEDYRGDDYSRRYWNVGVTVNWELFAGGGTTFAYLGNKKIAASLRKAYEDALAAARAEVIRSLLDINAARELITTSRKGLDAAAESYAMASKRYNTNTGTITELLDAQMRLTEAEANYSAALTEFQAARSRFYYNIGRENVGLE